MCENEILEEIYRIREEHAKAFSYDLNDMFEDLQKTQYEDSRQVVNLTSKRRTRHYAKILKINRLGAIKKALQQLIQLQ